MDDLHSPIRHLAANRHSPEARALYDTLARYVQKRVRHLARSSVADLFTDSELDELVGDVLLQLMTGSLAAFRGDTVPELIAYVRTITDRRCWRVARKRIQERDMLREAETHARRDLAARPWSSRDVQPDQVIEFVPDTPLSDKDADYLAGLLRAGSKAAYARQHNLSRAAVTQRVKRIQSRIAAMAPGEQMAVDVWLRREAREALHDEAEAG